jgi:hypothetical protein
VAAEATNEQAAEAFQREDAAGLAMVYAKQAVALPPNAECV